MHTFGTYQTGEACFCIHSSIVTVMNRLPNYLHLDRKKVESMSSRQLYPSILALQTEVIRLQGKLHAQSVAPKKELSSSS